MSPIANEIASTVTLESKGTLQQQRRRQSRADYYRLTVWSVIGIGLCVVWAAVIWVMYRLL